MASCYLVERPKGKRLGCRSISLPEFLDFIFFWFGPFAGVDRKFGLCFGQSTQEVSHGAIKTRIPARDISSLIIIPRSFRNTSGSLHDEGLSRT